MSKQNGKRSPARHAVDKMTDTLGGMAGSASAAMTTTAESFVENAAIGDMYEIEAATIALQRSGSPQVKQAAIKMIEDHGCNTHHLQAALMMNETRGVAKPPAALDKRREKMVEHLRTAPDDQFDQTYLDQQVLAHQETVSLMTSYRDGGDNPQLRSLAAAAAPVVERHLAMMKSMRAELA